jgi:hypothetical protein
MFKLIREWWNGRADPIHKDNENGTYSVTYQMGEPSRPWIRRLFQNHKKKIFALFFAALIALAASIGTNFGDLLFIG